MPRARKPGFNRVESEATARTAARFSGFQGYYKRVWEWSDVVAATVVDGIAAALSAGAAVTFSQTSDGGAICVTLWVDGTRHKAYAGDADTLHDLMAELAAMAAGPSS